MPAAQLNLTVPAYADLRVVIDVVGGPSTLVGYVGKMQIRATAAATATLADYGASEITCDNTTRTVSVIVLAAVTQAYTWTQAVYDLVITGSDGTYRIAEGSVLVTPGVTRS